jgi:hypothetical protein
MTGDFSKRGFAPSKNFTGVFQQQGRVQLDSDWNEYVDIQDRQWRAETLDIIGRSGVPDETPNGFLIIPDKDGKPEVTVGPGRIYVDGILVDNHRSAMPGGASKATSVYERVLQEFRSTTQQPIPLPKQKNDTFFPNYFAYLEVWQREVSAAEDEDLLESALPGVDTATRRITMSDVRLEGFTAGNYDAIWDRLPLASAARLKVKKTESTKEAEADADLCEFFTETATSFENRLYRLEIGSIEGSKVKLKFSKDNASQAVKVILPATPKPGDPAIITLVPSPRFTSLKAGNFVEIRDKNGIGKLTTVKRIVDKNKSTIELEEMPEITDRESAHLIRWDGAFDSEFSAPAGEKVAKFDIKQPGIDVELKYDDANGGQPFVGDYWIFRTRLPAELEELDFVPPRGTHRHFAKLATFKFPVAGSDVEDLRDKFLPLTKIAGEPELHYYGGDAQEADPNGKLPQPLRVAIFREGKPFDGKVQFTILEGPKGKLKKEGDPTEANSIPVETKNGVAECFWTLDTSTTVADPHFPLRHQRVEASLLTGETESAARIHFNASLRLPELRAIEVDGPKRDKVGLLIKTIRVQVLDGGRPVKDISVGFFNRTIHPDDDAKPDATVPTDLHGFAEYPWQLEMAPSSTEQILEAQLLDSENKPFLNRLRWVVDGRSTIQKVNLPKGGHTLENGEYLGAAELSGGITLTLPETVQLSNLNEATCFVAAEVPGYLLGDHLRVGFDVLFQMIVVGSIQQAGGQITWMARDPELFARWEQQSERPILLRLNLLGNFLNTERGNVDGDSLGDHTPGPLLPSGDGRNGGDFRMWFWLGSPIHADHRSILFKANDPNPQTVKLEWPQGLPAENASARVIEQTIDGEPDPDPERFTLSLAAERAENFKLASENPRDLHIKLKTVKDGTFAAILEIKTNDVQPPLRIPISAEVGQPV